MVEPGKYDHIPFVQTYATVPKAVAYCLSLGQRRWHKRNRFHILSLNSWSTIYSLKYLCLRNAGLLCECHWIFLCFRMHFVYIMHPTWHFDDMLDKVSLPATTHPAEGGVQLGPGLQPRQWRAGVRSVAQWVTRDDTLTIDLISKWIAGRMLQLLWQGFIRHK